MLAELGDSVAGRQHDEGIPLNVNAGRDDQRTRDDECGHHAEESTTSEHESDLPGKVKRMAEPTKDPHVTFNSGNPVFDATVTIVASRGVSTFKAISEIHTALLALTNKEPGGFVRLNGASGATITVADPGTAQ